MNHTLIKQTVTFANESSNINRDHSHYTGKYRGAAQST